MRASTLAVLLACVLAGCGGGKSAATSSSGTTHPTTASSTTSAGGPVTHASALAFAHEVNLRPGDIPGTVEAKSEGEGPAPKARARRFATCAGAAHPGDRVLEERSATLRIGSGAATGEIKSSVEVMPSARLAHQTFFATKSARGRACLSGLLPEVLGQTPGGARYSHVRIAAIAPPLGSDSFGYRIRATVTSKRPAGLPASVTIYFDALELLDGPAEIGVTDFSVGRPPLHSLEARAIGIVAERAKSHRL